MSSRRRKGSELARDKRQIARWYLAGMKQAEIAEKLGIDQSTVSRDLKALQAEWQESTLIDIDAERRKALARIDQLEIEYYEAWLRSCQPKETEASKLVTDQGAGERNEASLRTEQRDGDPRYLAGVQWCIERRCKLLGLDAPTKIAPTDPTGDKPYDAGLDPKRLGRLVDLLNTAGARRDSDAAG